MASGATRRRRLPPGVDYTRALSVELLAFALDYLDQPDVLRTARVSKWWRAVAISHPHYYRLVRADNNVTDYVSDSSWSGNKKFHDQLDDAAKGDGAITAYRVVVHFRLHNGYGRENSLDKLRALVKTLTARTVPRLHALFPRIKALRLVFPDDLRPVVFDMLRHPAPVLESLCLEFTDPKWYNSDYEDNSYPDSEGEDADGIEAPNVESDHKSVVPTAAAVNSKRFLPSDLLGGEAPRLRSIDLSGVRLGGKPISVLSRVRNAHINLTVPLHSLGRSPAEHFPALSRLILGINEESIPESGLPRRSFVLPATLSSFCIRAFDDSYVEDILQDTGIVSSTPDRVVPAVEVELMGDNYQYTSRQYDWATLLNEVDAAQSMRIEYYPAKTYRHFFSIASDLSLSIESANGIVRTVHWTESDFCTREDAHDEEHYFTQFKDFSRLRCSSLQLIAIAHPYLPALFALKELPSLRRLEIDMDEFKAPFWKTQATDESDDYAGGDHTPPRRPTPPPRRPPRPPRPSPPRRKGRNRRGRRGQWYDEDFDEDSYDPDDPWREDDMDGIPRWYSNWESSSAECGLLNTFDQEDEKYTLQCPALETVVLRTLYSHTTVHMRQLAHFGRALGLLDREGGSRPRLVLLGVELSCTRYGTLHLKVFDEVEQVPLPAVRYRKDDWAGNHGPETDYEDYVSDEEHEAEAPRAQDSLGAA